MTRRVTRRQWGALMMGAALTLGETACGMREDSGMSDWVERTKSLEERQTIEDHQAAVEIQLGRFVEQLGVQSGSTTLLSPSEVSSRINDGYMMFSALIAFKQPVSDTKARELAEQLFSAVDLDFITDQGDNIFSMIFPTEDL